ncbi:MAG: efflux RND transporter periplasmic adaptor subunit [Glaciecola sp.]|jgi:Cu(I)/Ag(I) efflux system membrane fusion protein
MNKNNLNILMIGILLGGLLGATVIYFALTSTASHEIDTAASQTNEILYWVAPMDPNFQRDEPGKSPMGMDLVPVYANEQTSPGLIKVSPVTVQNLGVKTATVAKKVPSDTLKLFGEVRYANDNIVHIHPRVAGWVEKLTVRSKGDYIEKGEALYSLYSPSLVNAQEEYLLGLKQGNKALTQAARSRLISLNAPESLIEKINKDRKIKRAITYFAPQSGYLSELNIQEGFYVTPSTTMLAIANMDSIWVLVDIFANDINKVTLGSEVRIESPFANGLHFTSNIEYIYPSISTDTRTQKARIKLDNPEHILKPGMYLDVVVNTNHTNENILTIPKPAVIRTGLNDRVVLSLGEGRFKSVEIKLGRVYDNDYEVLAGLDEGDLIVTSAQFLLDSESSISSDLKRMEKTSSEAQVSSPDDMNVSSWTQATVNEVLVSERIVNLSHGPLLEFEMMGMTMNFTVADDIDISQFQVDQEVHVEIVKSSTGMYQVKTVHFMDEQHNMPAMDETNDEGKIQ